MTVSSVRRDQVEAAMTLGACDHGILARVLIPASAPDIAEILRLVLGWAWTYVIVAELIGSSSGIGHMIMVSSVGADRASRNFYLRVKGETEDALAKVGLARLDILRPGLIRGPRQERRPAEHIARLASPLTDLLLHGGFRRYRSMKADTLADAVFALAREKARGRFVHEYDAIRYAIRRARG